MGVYLKRAKAVYLETPKTGSQWVWETLKKIGIEVQRLKSPMKVSNSHGLACHFPNLKPDFCFTSVRHPLSWIKSYWSYQKDHGWKDWEPKVWHPFHELSDCNRLPFIEFVERMCESHPGFVSRLFEWYAGPVGAKSVNVVLKQESLAEDLGKVLERLGYGNRLKKLQSMKRFNTSKSKTPELPEELVQRFLYLEQAAIKRWYEQ